MSATDRQPAPEHAALHSHIIGNIDEGIVTVGLDGAVLDFNPAAARLLGMAREAALGQPFGTLFLLDERNDAFAQAVIDAVYEADTTHNRVVRYHREDGSSLPLALSTSFLKDESQATRGVIAVFRDVSELERLRDAERSLADELRENNHKLAEAVLEVEQANAALQAAGQRERVVRGLAAAFVVLLAAGFGGYQWLDGGWPGGDIELPRLGGSRAPVTQMKAFPSTVVTVEPRPFRSSIKLTGFIAPLQVVNVVSPLDGHVAERHFRYGEQVRRGQPLFSVGVEETRVKHREARAAYINALEELRKLENWEHGAEVVRARRALTRAKLNVASLRQKAEETKRLLDLGIVAAAEYQSQREQLATARMEYRAADDDLEHTLAQGGEEQQTVARLKLENAEYQMNELQRKLDGAAVRAPVTGVVLQPSGRDAEEKRIEVGSAVQEGAVALSIGDLEGVSVKVAVDEIEIGRMRVGQTVLVRGDAFPGIELRGTVARVSSQASEQGFGGGVPTFEIDVQVERLDDAQRERIRVGMSAELEVLVYDRSRALLVPIGAVGGTGDGHFVSILDEGAQGPRRQPVETGLTTPAGEVEILSGLTAGARVVVQGGPAGVAEAISAPPTAPVKFAAPAKRPSSMPAPLPGGEPPMVPRSIPGM
ncbi:efflux RND transporter periplasmic adaptor subunit [Endothiovibrio diazotrophicus]